MDDQVSNSRARRQAISIQEPEIGSLRHSIVTNPSKRLYVHPGLWTPEILQFLNCVCQPLPQNLSTGESPPAVSAINLEPFIGSPHYWRTSVSLSKVILATTDELRDKAVRILFADLVRLTDMNLRYALRGTGSELPLLFGQKTVAWVFCSLLVWEKKTSTPVCAFIDQAWMYDHRRKCFPARMFKNNQARAPASSQMESPASKSTWLEPINPYFVAIMIAMAQARSEVDRLARPIYLFTHSRAGKSLTLYTAEVTLQFLNKLADPYRRSDSLLSINQQNLGISSLAELLSTMTMVLETHQQPSLQSDCMGADREQETSSSQLSDHVEAHQESMLHQKLEGEPLPDVSNLSMPPGKADPSLPPFKRLRSD